MWVWLYFLSWWMRIIKLESIRVFGSVSLWGLILSRKMSKGNIRYSPELCRISGSRCSRYRSSAFLCSPGCRGWRRFLFRVALLTFGLHGYRLLFWKALYLVGMNSISLRYLNLRGHSSTQTWVYKIGRLHDFSKNCVLELF